MQQQVETTPASDSRTQALLKPTESGFWQLIRFGIVGAAATAADYVVMLGLYTRIHASEGWSVAAGYAVGLIVCYVFSIAWVFSHRSVKDKRVEFIAFMLIGVIGYLLTALTVKLGLHLLAMLPPAVMDSLADFTASLIRLLDREPPQVDARFVGAIRLAVAKGAAIVLVFFFNFWSRKALLFRNKTV